LEVTPVGSKRWYLKYRQVNGKEDRLSFGVYPDVSLGDAHEKRAAGRKQLAEGIDPAAVRDAQGRAARKPAEDMVSAVGFCSVGLRYEIDQARVAFSG
jgi:hypothetical protein